MNFAVLPSYFSTRVVTFVVAVFFGPSPSRKVIIFAMASGYSCLFLASFLAFLLLKYYNFLFPTLCRPRQKWTPRPWRRTLSSQKTFSLLFLVFDKVELGHSSTHIESEQKIHQGEPFNTPASSDLVFKRKIYSYFTGNWLWKSG